MDDKIRKQEKKTKTTKQLTSEGRRKDEEAQPHTRKVKREKRCKRSNSRAAPLGTGSPWTLSSQIHWQSCHLSISAPTLPTDRNTRSVGAGNSDWVCLGGWLTERWLTVGVRLSLICESLLFWERIRIFSCSCWLSALFVSKFGTIVTDDHMGPSVPSCLTINTIIQFAVLSAHAADNTNYFQIFIISSWSVWLAQIN